MYRAQGRAREGTSLQAVWSKQRGFSQAITCTTGETGQQSPDLYITGFSHQPVLLHLALSINLRVSHAPENVSSPIWIKNLCYCSTNSAEGRVLEGLDWHTVMRLFGHQHLQACPLCLPFCLYHCPEAVNTSPTAALRGVCSHMLGLNLGGCNAGTGADVQMLLWGWYLLAEGWGQPRAETSHTPASGSAKACAPKPWSALLQGNPFVFFHCRRWIALHVQKFHT